MLIGVKGRVFFLCAQICVGKDRVCQAETVLDTNFKAGGQGQVHVYYCIIDRKATADLLL